MVTLLQNILLEKALQPPFLVTVVLQNFLQQPNLVFGLYSALQHTQLVIQHVMIISNVQEIMETCCINHIHIV